MWINLSKEVIEKLGMKKLEEFGLTEDKIRWHRDFDVNLSDLTRTRMDKLRGYLVDAGKLKLKGATTRVADIDRWVAILDGEKVRCKKIKEFAPMLKQYLKTAPKHWVYQIRPDSQIHQPYYVENISYTTPSKSHGYWHPAYVMMGLWWEELGKMHQTSITFYSAHCEDMTVGKALALKGYVVESPDTIASYLANRQKYMAICDKVGKQFLATGIAEEEAKKESYWYRRGSKIILERDGVMSRVVVDVLKEGDTENENGESHPPNAKFWMREECDFDGDPDDDDNDIEPGDEDPDDPAEHEVAQIPLSPALMCFDMKRHTRLKIYVDQLTEYVYQKDLADKLILPDEITNLVDMLVAHKGGFQDIVGNKGGGAIILCAGPPGTGKTLTSEIYSEAMERPLYSVQCSQLGVDPEELEKELLMTFARAQRWNAILLLDEADVYVASRGRDLTQNAIVGVFLRVLEYYGGVLFMTTNRADLVDDAIASRCLARIGYDIPTPDNQKRIWRTLADTAGITLDDGEIDIIVKKFPHLSGRDVKNLLKLASMVASANGHKEIDFSTVSFVKQFKPTTDADEHRNDASAESNNSDGHAKRIVGRSRTD
jgi:hypothetical protein